MTYRALLIGNNDYPGTINDLENGPLWNLFMMQSALERSSLNGLAYSDITVMADRSKGQILSAIASLKNKGIDSNDVTMFFYSGHGAQDAPTEEQTGLVGVDDQIVNVPELKAALDAIPGTVIVILDSCFSGMFIGKSGTVSKSAAAFNPKGFNEVIGDAFSGPQAKGLTSSKYHVITGCRKNESAMSGQVGTTSSGDEVWIGFSSYFIALAGGFDLFDQDANDLNCDLNDNKIATIKEVFDFADYYVDQLIADINDPEITQDMQYYTTNTSYPIFGRN